MKSIFNRKVCTTCLKLSEAFICRGCQQPFCAKHVNQHRDKITKDMGNLVNKYNRLHEEAKTEKFAQESISSIDKWEKESIERIRLTAQAARADLKPWIERIKAEFDVPFKTIITELQTRQKLQDYTEVDLKRWSTQLKEFSDKLKQRPIIDYIEFNDTQAIHLIKVIDRISMLTPFDSNITYSRSDRSLNVSQESTRFDKEEFGETFGAVTLSEHNHMASYGGPWIGDASACGTNLYSSGVYHLRFRIIEKFYNAPFLGICTSSQPMTEHMIRCPSTNGWSNFEFPVINGKEEVTAKDRILRPGDALKMTIDCDRQQLLLRHLRTNRLSQLTIDIRVCPFPWKLLVVLQRRDDAIRILGGSVGITNMDLDNLLPNTVKT